MSIVRSLTEQFGGTAIRAEQLAEFHAALFAAVADGKLTEGEMKELELKREAYGLTEKDIDSIRIDLYLHAYRTVTADEQITEEEWKELEKIQLFLGIEDSEIAGTKRELLRMHILHEVRRGNLPVIHVVDLALQKGEIAHWEEPSQLTDEKGKVCTGELIVTSKRVVFRSTKKSLAIRLPSILDVTLLKTGVRITEGNKDPKTFAVKNPGHARIVHGVLRESMRKYGKD